VKEMKMAERASVTLSIGDASPRIAATTALGEAFELTEQRGKWVVIYFYPRANTPG
jgi:thioredoxin-dependent peroxiredoxin